MSPATKSPDVSVTESTDAAEQVNSRPWLGAIGAGLLGGIAMGVVVAVAMPDALDSTIPTLYGQSGDVAGWTVHLVHSAVFGVVFAALLAVGALTAYGEKLTTSTALGFAYGVVLWRGAASIVMPAWLGAVGVSPAPAVPTFNWTSLGAHAVYGLVLGVVFPYLKRY